MKGSVAFSSKACFLELNRITLGFVVGLCLFWRQKYRRLQMKNIVLAAALTLTASTAFAGNMEEPMMEAPVIVEETSSSSSAGGIILPLMAILLLAAAASN
jgi:hypothetical protein